MTKKDFLDLCDKRYIYLDGATGSNLQRKGLAAGECPETWILEHPQALVELQKAYVDAGTNILYAPTFTANRIKLAEYGMQDRVDEINRRLVSLSKQAAGDKAYVAGDITMTGQQLAPMGTLDFEELIDIYKEQIQALVDGGADLLVIETMMSLQEARAALIAAKETSELPVMVTLTFESDGKTLFGSDPATAMVVLQSLGASAVGVNCSTGPEEMAEVVRVMKSVAKVPVIAKPNAGLPALDADGNTIYEMDPEQFGEAMKMIAKAGSTIMGGCCGTTPEHIAALVSGTKDLFDDCGKLTGEKVHLRHLASERQTLSFGLDDKFILIGERINPTGKKKFQESIRNGDFSMVEEFVSQQEAGGAQVLDINMGMSGIDEKATLLQVMEDVALLTKLPLCIDSSYVDVQESALRRYPGRALINSVSLETEKFEKLLPLAKKYGAMFILLPLSDEGLPKSLSEKKEIIHKIMDRALSLGLTKEDIIVDGLVTTVGANPNAALETLETIRYCKQLGLATVCGLSNISFGLPERGYINATFLTMAIANGLTMAIANPNQELLTSCMLASDLLLAKEGADLRYITTMNARKEALDGAVGANVEVKASLTAQEKVYQAVLKGNKKQILTLVQQCLDDGIEPKTLLDETLLKAINEVGDLFDKGKYFLPQLIAGAESMKMAVEYLEPMLLKDNDSSPKATIVLATVEGDIHDIGKNLVVLMLKNYGFRVIDLGKDVSADKIIETAVAEKADLVGLSALMTTTMQQMRTVIDEARKQNQHMKFMVGGAVITQEYADEIGADGYAKDAAEAVRVATRLLGL
ncbi:MAG: 5-methyltetrahydrofolate--homocysteine methyltransferase [Lachnospiraceae bacterium]|nr:5-methyltetrahydrofolate--homocysteine methyltransferase [Lachnospiraceae bacterium]